MRATPATQVHLDTARSIAERAEKLESDGGATFTRGERTELLRALNRVTLAQPGDQSLTSLRAALRRPTNESTLLRVGPRGQVQQLRPPVADFVNADGMRRLLAERNPHGWTVHDGPEGRPPIVRDRRGAVVPPENVRQVMGDLQTTRNIPVHVTVNGEPRPGQTLDFDAARPGIATTRPGAADNNTYQLIPNASIDRTDFPVQAIPLGARLRQMVEQSGLQRRGDDLSDPTVLARYFERVQVNTFDNYNVALMDGDLVAAIRSGAIIRPTVPIEGQTGADAGRWRIGPALAGRPPDGGLHNPWGISHLDVALRTPR